MGEPKSVVWQLDEHTRGKHLVLKHYLGAWFPIIGSRSGRLLFIDGFAGPGEYAGGEVGSPIIALDTYLDHKHRDLVRGEAVFVFIEKNAERARHLQGMVDQRRDRIPENCTVKVEVGSFDAHMTTVLDELRAAGQVLAPAFTMIDPFGISDTPMEVIEKILANPKAEVYVSFMSEAINRFAATDEFASHLDALFGTPEWRQGVELADGEERRAFFYDMYERQLRLVGARQVVRFELLEGNRLVYAIFFGTKSTKGSDRMKEAIWKAVPLGDFSFRGVRGGQVTLALESADFRPLIDALLGEFRAKGWVPIEAVKDFVRSDGTDYYTGQLRTRALIPLEESGALEVKDGTRKRRYAYPEGTIVRFM